MLIFDIYPGDTVLYYPLPKWIDIADAMEELIGSAPDGIKPIFRQAIDEIRMLRNLI